LKIIVFFCYLLFDLYETCGHKGLDILFFVSLPELAWNEWDMDMNMNMNMNMNVMNMNMQMGIGMGIGNGIIRSVQGSS
jgi:hypothetical protein